jgi:hypothetical protein
MFLSTNAVLRGRHFFGRVTLYLLHPSMKVYKRTLAGYSKQLFGSMMKEAPGPGFSPIVQESM